MSGGNVADQMRRAGSTPTEIVLGFLENVQRRGPDRWLARCPAHRDRTPSLSIREGYDGCALLYCFAGCSTYNVLDAIGLDMADLFPRRPQSSSSTSLARRRVAPPIPARDALELLEEETIRVEITAIRLAQGEPIEAHCEALEIAAGRIAAIRSAWIEQPKPAERWST